MDITSRPVLIYRSCVFLLAAGYGLYQTFFGHWSDTFGPFRYLTIWALFISIYAASRMLALSLGRIERRHEVTAICASVFNLMVVYLYWRLFFIDPTLVNGGRAPIWHQEFYLHLIGPALQVVDALFIARAYRRVWRAALPLIGIVGLYVLFCEFVLQPLNDTPSGDVTSGLPYPFLNDMVFSERLGFYGANVGMAVALLVPLGLLGWLFYRSSDSRAESPSR